MTDLIPAHNTQYTTPDIPDAKRLFAQQSQYLTHNAMPQVRNHNTRYALPPYTQYASRARPNT